MRRVLITAGATRNPIDAMRYISAFSSGTTGVWLGRELRAAGLTVLLLGSAEARLRAPELPGEEFTSTRDLLARMERLVLAHPGAVVVHAAAVGDYEAATAGGKIASGQPELTLRLTPTPKIVDLLKRWDPTIFLVSFKAAPPETGPEDLRRIADAQRQRTSSDLVFANVLGSIHTGVQLVDAQGARRWSERGPALEALRDAILAIAGVSRL
jgi:phosphopantothenoylcysteine decarboxylase/phosphopantothenate--cysteine ligase